MMCKICKKDATCVCLCGFCNNCVRLHGHQGCAFIIENNKKENQHGN